MTQKLILASSSKYRANLLSRLNTNFSAIAPEIDESQQNKERPEDYVKRLSIEKANIIANEHESSWVIGSDQIAEFEGKMLGKPGNFDKALQQLISFSGKQVLFRTGLALVNISENVCHYKESKTSVHFKTLNQQKITEYLQHDKPYDCAGSFKIESRGATLFEKVQSDDPTSLEGLPLIELCLLFDRCNLNPLVDF
ncbi:Maf family protein [Aliikangiella coralliicola]|uniref:7-methyl-GTP pyrophosphatase n=1 Tax=Aliikangiella coralliicola TaxID=2592383 RepID=A0A545UD43_9GAMM|nr:nucleoside triphosphate pyrophosphatase [Aliikangiella coralliicola]TQV87382.1 septum formation protein Maf [Aliikangiella coralliicola]